MNEDSNVKTVIGRPIDTSDDSDYHIDEVFIDHLKSTAFPLSLKGVSEEVQKEYRSLERAFKAGVKWAKKVSKGGRP